MKVFGQEYSKRELEALVGDMQQIFGIKKYILDDGKAKGVSACDIRTGGGLSITVLIDRCMDISFAEYKGIPLCFLSKTGITNPMYFYEPGNGYIRGFFAGLLSTCGFTYMGDASIDEGKALGKHGRSGNIPAEQVNTSYVWQGDELTLQMNGLIRESAISSENILLDRTISVKAGYANLYISDLITNCGFLEEPLMMLYHFNFGFPLLSQTAKLFLPIHKTTAFDEESEQHISKWNCFSAPDIRNKDLVYYHDIKEDDEGYVSVGLFNEMIGETGIGISIRYHKSALPILVQWKSIKEGDYVIGIEPANAHVDGRSAARKRNELTMLQAGESRKFEIEMSVLDGEEAFKEKAEKYGWEI